MEHSLPETSVTRMMGVHEDDVKPLVSYVSFTNLTSRVLLLLLLLALFATYFFF